MVNLGELYAYAPMNGLTPKLVQVCGVAFSDDKPGTFMVRYVTSDGRLSNVCSEVLGWFKSVRALSRGWGRLRTVDPTGRDNKQLTLKITEKVA